LKFELNDVVDRQDSLETWGIREDYYAAASARREITETFAICSCEIPRRSLVYARRIRMNGTLRRTLMDDGIVK